MWKTVIQLVLPLNNSSSMMSLIMPILSTFFVFDMGAVFIILQENYHKCHDPNLLKRITHISFFLLIIPLFLLLVPLFVSIGRILCIVLILLSAVVAVVLIWQLRKTLDPIYLLEKLILPKIKKDDCLNYKNGNAKPNNNIDSLLKTIVGAVESKENNSMETVFSLLMEWVKINIETIGYETDIEFLRAQNKFNQFFTTVEESVILSNSYVIQVYYLKAVEKQLDSVEFRLLKQFDFIYERLSVFTHRLILNGDDKIVSYALFVLNKNTSRFLDDMDDSETDSPSDDYIHFRNVVLKPIHKNIKFGIENGRTSLLSNLRIMSVLMGNKEREWNSNKYRYVLESMDFLHVISNTLSSFDQKKQVLHEYECAFQVVSSLPFNSIIEKQTLIVVLNILSYLLNDIIDEYPCGIRFYDLSFLLEAVKDESLILPARKKIGEYYFIIMDYLLGVLQEKKPSSDSLFGAFGIISSVQKLLEHLNGSDKQDNSVLGKSLSKMFDSLKSKYNDILIQFEGYCKKLNDFWNNITEKEKQDPF